MTYYGKGFNDGSGDESPRFIPADVKPVTFIPVGEEDKYIKDSHGNWWKKVDWARMKIGNK